MREPTRPSVAARTRCRRLEGRLPRGRRMRGWPAQPCFRESAPAIDAPRTSAPVRLAFERSARVKSDPASRAWSNRARRNFTLAKRIRRASSSRSRGRRLAALSWSRCTSTVPPHPLDALGMAAGLPGAEENCGHGSRRREPPQDREHIAKQPALEEQPHQRRPMRRSSMRAHSMTPTVGARCDGVRAGGYRVRLPRELSKIGCPARYGSPEDAQAP